MQAESAERISLLEDEVKSLSLKLDESCSRLETVGADIEILERQLEEERAKTPAMRDSWLTVPARFLT